MGAGASDGGLAGEIGLGLGFPLPIPKKPKKVGAAGLGSFWVALGLTEGAKESGEGLEWAGGRK